MSALKQCPRGHYYQGDVCPYCPTQYYPNSGHTRPTRTAGPNQHTPTFYPTETPTSTAAGADIPLCPHCGRPIRKFVPKDAGISSIKCLGDGIVPWNYKWDGRCESCGHDFNVVMNINMGSYGPDCKTRQTIVKVSSRGFCHNAEALCGEGWASTELSGVEIETKCGGNVEKIFLSANELKYLIKVLRDSPILKQLDYYEVDGTAYSGGQMTQ